MPDKDGIELAREVKSTQSGDEMAVKVLIITLRDNKEAVLAAFAAGVDSYCMKDTKYDNLLEALRVTHSGNAWIDPVIACIVQILTTGTVYLEDKGVFLQGHKNGAQISSKNLR